MTRSYSNWFVRARLKTRQLLLLAAMEEEGNVRRAADSLGITQPAASRLLKELEDMLGVSLFDRTPHGMRATLYGEVMIRHARMVLSNLSHAHDEISALRAGLTGQVRIGVIAAAAATMVPRAIASVKADADRFAKNVAPIIREIQSSGVASHRGIARSLNARGIATARGGVWTAVQVGAILQRVAQ